METPGTVGRSQRAVVVARLQAASEKAAAEKAASEARAAERIATAKKRTEKIERYKLLEEQRVTNNLANQIPITQDLDPKRRAELERIGENALNDFALAVQGQIQLDQIKQDQGSVRKYFEKYDGDQCKGALPHKKLVVGQSECWICGFIIRNKPGFTNECEHVFPIAQAVFFIDLYRGKNTTPLPAEILELEQDWSHEVCNQTKNDTHFLKAEGEGLSRKWNVNEEQIVTFLNDLSTTNRVGGDLLRTEIEKVGKETWITARTQKIKNRCQAILDNTIGKCPGPELFTLASLANCMEPLPEDTPSDETARALFPNTPGIKRTREQAGIGRTLTPVRTLGAFKKGRRRTRKAKSRNRRTRRKKFTA